MTAIVVFSGITSLGIVVGSGNVLEGKSGGQAHATS